MRACKHCNLPTTNPQFCSKSCTTKHLNRLRVHSTASKLKRSTTIKALGLKHSPPSQRGKRWAKAPNRDWLSYRASAAFYIPRYLLPYIEGVGLIDVIGWYHPTSNPTGASRDHILSVKFGWQNNVPINVIRHPANCRIVPDPANRQKGAKCAITLPMLMNRINAFNTRLAQDGVKFEMDLLAGFEPATSAFVAQRSLGFRSTELQEG